MHILIHGGKGYLGNQLCQILNDLDIKYSLSTIRADNYEDVENEIKSNNYTHVIDCIGRTYGTINDKPEYSATKFLEQNLDINIKDNLISHINICLCITKYNIHYTYFSSGCLYNNKLTDLLTETNAFREDDPPNYKENSYSIMKIHAEKILMNINPNILILRIRLTLSKIDNPKNFICKYIKYDKINNIPNSFTVIEHLFPYIPRLLSNHAHGILNFVNPGLISPLQIVQHYYNINNIPITNLNGYELFDSPNCYLDTTKLLNYIPEIQNINEIIIELIKDFSLNT
jgi:dTDP-4-dehydrorhamnose reductase